jgi:hypothetical protein
MDQRTPVVVREIGADFYDAITRRRRPASGDSATTSVCAHRAGPTHAAATRMSEHRDRAGERFREE